MMCEIGGRRVAREQRRLAAIVAADVAGYSRLMGRDESGTLAALKVLRRDVVDPPIASHGGRVVKTTGDGLLAEFPSVVDAVRCVIEVQTAMAAKTAQVPEDRRIAFRVGVNLGDIIIDGDDIFGDGVNIAARLEALAEPGGACLADDAFRQVRGKIDAGFVEMGAQTLKNIDQPVLAWRWSPNSKSNAHVPVLAVPDMPSIAVLPFICPGGTPEQEAFADGITESLITDLSRQNTFTVVARTTSLALKRKAIDVRELGRMLGVRYVLEGSVQPGTGRVRVNVQLISAIDGIHLWADRFDKKLGDLLDVQDEIAERTSRAVNVQLREAEIRRATDGAKEARDPSTLLLLGRRIFVQGYCRMNTLQATALYAEAIKLDERNAAAHAAMSIAKSSCHINLWTDSPKDDLEEAILHRDRARALDPNLPYVQVASAWILAAEHKYDAAFAAFERVAQAAPTAGGNAFANLALIKNGVGRSAEAEADLLRVIRITPNDPQMDVWFFILGVTYVLLGRYPEAVEAFQSAISRTPEYDLAHLCLAACLVAESKIEEARAAIKHAQSLGTRWTVRAIKTGTLVGTGVGADEARMAAFWHGLRLAGLPE